MLNIETLNAYGADTADGLRRCMNMEDFYLSLVQSAIEDDQIPALVSAIEAEDLDTAFEVAHALKGIYANLSLTPLLTPTSEITELLRARTKTDYTALLAEIRTQRDKLAALSYQFSFNLLMKSID